MKLPPRIPIARIENSYTRNIGTFNNGEMFMGFVVADFDKHMPMPVPADWSPYKRWYSILHLFDSEGHHVETKHWFAGRTSDGEGKVIELAKDRLDTFISELSGVQFRDISVCLFKTTIDDCTFGLVANHNAGYVQLLPNDFIFSPPWNGEFDT